MTNEEKLRDIVRKAAAFSLPSNTQEFHLDMFTNSLMASGVKIGKNTNVSRWIPVTERLPEDGQIVLTCKNGICEVQTYEARRNGWVSGRFFWSMAFATHWMPLPDAPKDGE